MQTRTIPLRTTCDLFLVDFFTSMMSPIQFGTERLLANLSDPHDSSAVCRVVIPSSRWRFDSFHSGHLQYLFHQRRRREHGLLVVLRRDMSWVHDVPLHGRFLQERIAMDAGENHTFGGIVHCPKKIHQRTFRVQLQLWQINLLECLERVNLFVVRAHVLSIHPPFREFMNLCDKNDGMAPMCRIHGRESLPRVQTWKGRLPPASERTMMVL